MSYTVSILREDEIALEELEAIEGLTIQHGISATNPRTGEEMTLGGLFALWNDMTFMYTHGRLDATPPDDDGIARMRELATLLGARVQGEEGEYYDEDRGG